MKVNLVLGNEKEYLNHYINIDPLNENPSDSYQRGDVSNLDWLTDNGSIEELIARNILAYFPTPATGAILQNWLRKIKLGGTVIIEDLDFEAVCHALSLNKITPNEAQKYLWGPQRKNWDVRKTGVSMWGVQDFLTQMGFKIMKHRFENYNFVIVAQRIG
jgi:hypothetical protein